MLSYFRLAKFNYKVIKGGMFLFTSQLTRSFGGFVILPILLKQFNIKDWVLCIIIIPLQLGFYFMIAFAQSDVYIYIGLY